jgi:MOSC domain-containing protein YiiM
MTATLEPSQGIVGDRKGSSGERQINVMSTETLAQLSNDGFHTAPGEMGEQLVISNIPINQFATGTRLRIGAEAVIEVVKPRTGCARFEHIQRCSRSDVAGRLGVMARVLSGGRISVGESVIVDGSDAS